MGTYKESQVTSKKLPEKSYSETRDEIWKAGGGGGIRPNNTVIPSPSNNLM